MSNPIRAVTAGIAVVALSSGIALAQSASVTLNGQPVALNPAPVERAGRIFVPLRGVFERLGASVVYQGGQINAQGANHSVALRIGSTQATVDGNAQNLDVAPFIVGASTYVPLRFVSQALGATVNYDGANRVVALSTNGAPVANNPPPPPARPAESAMRLRGVSPARGAAVESRRPTIEAQFTAPVDPNTIRVSLDGLNVTDQSSRSPNGIVFSPPSDLQSGSHTVAVTGTDANGQPFNQRWNFSSGTSTVTNSIQDLRPGEGASVGRQFSVTGHTLPGARVIVQAGTVNQPTSRDVIGQILGISGGGGQSTVRSEVIADGNGAFNAPVSLNAQPGSQVTLVVDSTDARTQTAAPRVVRNLTIQ